MAAASLRKHSCEARRRSDEATARDRARFAAVDRTPKSCFHKTAGHRHGTYACYVLDHCRCLPCASANANYESQRVRANAYGRGNLIDAAPVREHVAALGRAGIGLKTVGKLSGVAQGVLWKLMYGKRKPDGSQVPSARVRRDTASRLLAVHLEASALANGARVDSTGTRRRLQALVAAGWSVGRLSEQSGIDRQRLDGALSGREVVADTARRVRSLYDDLWDRRPPEDDHRSRIAASRSRNRARANGWLPPMAWDDDTIDDPSATPAAVVAQPHRSAVEPEEVDWLLRAGESHEVIARRLGVKPDSLLRILYRADRADLAERLTRRDGAA